MRGPGHGTLAAGSLTYDQWLKCCCRISLSCYWWGVSIRSTLTKSARLTRTQYRMPLTQASGLMAPVSSPSASRGGKLSLLAWWRVAIPKRSIYSADFYAGEFDIVFCGSRSRSAWSLLSYRISHSFQKCVWHVCLPFLTTLGVHC
jgi:hypothetical protein